MQKQQIQNQTDADNAFNQLQSDYLTLQYGDPNDPSKPGYYSMKGQDAVNAYQNTVQSLDQKRQAILSSLSNQRVRNSFDQASRRLQSYTMSDIGRHYAQQSDLVTLQTQQASENLADRAISANPLDDNVFNNNLADKLRAADTKATLAGASPDMRAWTKAQAMSGAVVARTDGLIGMGQYDKAQQFLAQHQGDVAPSEFARMSASLASHAQTANVANATNDILNNINLKYHWTPQGAVGGATDVKSAILGQESGNSDNAPISANGAVGPGQIKPETFARYAKPGESITNPQDNRAVSGRIVDDLQKKYPNDPARVAVGYFSGEGNIAPQGSATPWVRDTHDATGKSVSSYVADIQNRLGASSGIPAPNSAAAPQPQQGYVDKSTWLEQNRGDIIASVRQQAQADPRFAGNIDAQEKVVKRVSDDIDNEIKEAKARQQQDKNTVEQWLNGSLTGGQKPTDINQLPPQVAASYHRWEQFDPAGWRGVEKVLAANGKTDTSYGPGFYGLLAKAYTHEITEPSAAYQYVGDQTGNGITSAGLDRLTKEMKGANNPQGAGEAMMKKMFFDTAHSEISGSNAVMHDPEGDKDFEKFLSVALPAYDNARAKDISVSDIFNPKGAHYLGNLVGQFVGKDANKLARMNAAASSYAARLATPLAMGTYLKGEIAAGHYTRDQAMQVLQTMFPQLNMGQPQQATTAPPPSGG